MDQEQFVLVKWSSLPEVMQKTLLAKQLLETEEAKTVHEAVQKVGLSRSAFYKYKDSLFPVNTPREEIFTLSMHLTHRSGVLSSVLSAMAAFGGNILTIHQTIPLQGIAHVVISLEMTQPEHTITDLLAELRKLAGVHNVQLIGRG
ncbi:MAG: ACT domain-containing protein [Bacillaceae bacterium G1]|nr:ACT domain-containing protein [Bacillota bacterium]OJF18320.1 MAG: ACT domain-containing protein [Bacillaceae bacterium G1]